jgi:hypothetical protein
MVVSGLRRDCERSVRRLFETSYRRGARRRLFEPSAVVGYVRSAPATYGYLGILLATSCILTAVGPAAGDRLLLAQSTNLRHLESDPLRVLVGSAFWSPGRHDLLLCAFLFTLVLARVERRIGSLRTVVVFALGHVGASLAIGAGLWVALQVDAVQRSVVDAQDVGSSYGFFAVAAAMTFLVAPRLRYVYGMSLVAYLAISAALVGGFGDYGHLAAASLGFAAFPLVLDVRGGPEHRVAAALPSPAGVP